MEKLTDSQRHHLVMIRAGATLALNKTTLLNLYQRGLVTYRLSGKQISWALLTEKGLEVLSSFEKT